MEQRVAQFIARHRLLAPQGKHIVALSGGADSVALLLVLKRLGYTVEAAHCNFKLRGAESDRDEQFAKSLACRLNVPFHVIHFETAEYASLHKVSIEMAARQLRYRYFEQLLADIGADTVCVAHHQDDAVETLLMNLMRGAGLHGLTGIRPRNGHVVRPLLGVSRSDILAYLEAQGQDYVTDSTNLVADVLRNKLRLRLIPLMNELLPQSSANIARSASWLAEAERALDAATPSALERVCLENEAGRLTVSIARLRQEPSAEFLLFELLSPRGFTPSQVVQVAAALDAQPGTLFSSPTHDLLVDRSSLLVEPRRAPVAVLVIPEPGLYVAAGLRLRVELTADCTVSRSPLVATLDASRVRFPLRLRPAEPGDRFRPFGMKGASKLVSDYLTDRKRSLFEKRRQLVVTDATGSLLWLVGERTDDRYRVSQATKEVLRLSMESA